METWLNPTTLAILAGVGAAVLGGCRWLARQGEILIGRVSEIISTQSATGTANTNRLVEHLIEEGKRTEDGIVKWQNAVTALAESMRAHTAVSETILRHQEEILKGQAVILSHLNTVDFIRMAGMAHGHTDGGTARSDEEIVDRR